MFLPLLSVFPKFQSQFQRANDFKITERMTVGGQSFETTTMIKGARERSERHMNIAGMPAGMNMDTIDITQCDMQRTSRSTIGRASAGPSRLWMGLVVNLNQFFHGNVRIDLRR